MKGGLGGGCVIILFDLSVDWVGGFRGCFASDPLGSMLLFRLVVPAIRKLWSGIFSSARASQCARKPQRRPGQVNVAIMTGFPSGIL